MKKLSNFYRLLFTLIFILIIEIILIYIGHKMESEKTLREYKLETSIICYDK
ncbi:hypothetical protein SDC9_154915 [bioreactor metagenome]|uniref:Uncharacterized protein n=1 Tax=bioreactor metagenome TaxID=1076179 RepID=A0A645F4V9_9ZZZZ|nr:hypothetical protein [Clostridium sp. HMP27]